MGEHKYNPTAIAAKNGELPPKPEKLSTRETERRIRAMLYARMCAPFITAAEMQKGGMEAYAEMQKDGDGK